MGRRRSSGGAEVLIFGAIVIAVGSFVVAVVAAVVSAVVAFFLTPIPYVVIAIVLAALVVHRLREQRLRKLYFDAIAELEGLAGAGRGAVDRLWQRGSQEPDVQLLRAAQLAEARQYEAALGYVYSAGSSLPRIGFLSGGIPLRFAGLLEPIWLGGTPATHANCQLVFGHLQSLAGRTADATRTLGARVHEPHAAAALGALADAYVRAGSRDRAAAVLEQSLFRVGDPALERALRYKLATLLRESGAAGAAAAQFQKVLAGGEYGDARARFQEAQSALASAHAQRVDAEDERAFSIAVSEIQLAAGPKSRANALEAGMDSLQQPHVRQRLLLMASQLEVEAVLNKVAGLKTKKAKERNLIEALATLKSDDVPDELQQYEIALLERALGEIDASS